MFRKNSKYSMEDPEYQLYFDVDENARRERIVFNKGYRDRVRESELGSTINQLLLLDWTEPCSPSFSKRIIDAICFDDMTQTIFRYSGIRTDDEADIANINRLVDFLNTNREKLNSERNLATKRLFRTVTDIAFLSMATQRPECRFNLEAACIKIASEKTVRAFFFFSCSDMEPFQKKAYDLVHAYATGIGKFADQHLIHEKEEFPQEAIEIYRAIFVLLHYLRSADNKVADDFDQTITEIKKLLIYTGIHRWLCSGDSLERERQAYPEFVAATEFFRLNNCEKNSLIDFELPDDLITEIDELKQTKRYFPCTLFELFFAMIDSCIESGLELLQCKGCGNLFFRPYRRRDQEFCGRDSCSGGKKKLIVPKYGPAQILRKTRMEAARTRFKTVISNIHSKDEAGSVRMANHCRDLLYYQAVSDFIACTHGDFWGSQKTDVPEKILMQWIDYPLSIDAKTRRSLFVETNNMLEDVIEFHFKTIVFDPGLHSYRLEDFTFKFHPCRRFGIANLEELSYKIKNSSDEAIEGLARAGFMGYQTLGESRRSVFDIYFDAPEERKKE